MSDRRLTYWINAIENQVAESAESVGEQVAWLRELGRRLTLDAAELEVRCGTPAVPELPDDPDQLADDADHDRAPLCAVCGSRHWTREGHQWALHG